MVTEIHLQAKPCACISQEHSSPTKKGKTVEIHPADPTAFSKAGMVVTSLEAKCEILNETINQLY